MEQFRQAIEHALDLHKELYPGEPFHAVETFGGPGEYPEDKDGPGFYGSPHMFCQEAIKRGIKLELTIFEKNEERARSLHKQLARYKDKGCKVFVYQSSNDAAFDILKFRSFSIPFPVRGMVTIDPDGGYKLAMYKQMRTLFPEYSLLINYNCNALKRFWKQGNRLHLLDYMAELPVWAKCMTPPKDTWQWLVVYVNKDGIKPEKVDKFVATNTKAALPFFNRTALTKGQLTNGETILSLKDANPNIFDVLGLHLNRTDF